MYSSPQVEQEVEQRKLESIMEENNKKILEAQQKLVGHSITVSRLTQHDLLEPIFVFVAMVTGLPVNFVFTAFVNFSFSK